MSGYGFRSSNFCHIYNLDHDLVCEKNRFYIYMYIYVIRVILCFPTYGLLEKAKLWIHD